MSQLLAKKLRIQSGQKALVNNSPDGYFTALGDLPPEVSVKTKSRGRFDVVQVFARDERELARFAPRAIRAVVHDGLFWVCYPKKTSKLSRDLRRERV